ncbi:carboxypeptidase-like regulatory domain-containing protein [Hymenobacter rubripertinctus]|uniref:Carboxypeptidase-like regulatory domain-containing protein n=1 Tax=Hymenobacter rubripertinctus TaxID=2029981 RepID=A0A418QT36_9BACT|nr:carboxypeptidase-like regulatory domain-containing protein [Hymenobacter rubripertinctus]RIY08294.1 carboxypeptidase-like regulatory domain-containing protein [Hymenobacter rubripertinctus]
MKSALLLLLVFLLIGGGAHGQQILLKGRVLDEKSRPVPYASVGVEGADVGTATNEAGEFLLRVPRLPQQLKVGSLGFEPVVQLVTSATAPLVVRLKSSAVALPEVRVRNPQQVATELVQRASAKLARHQRQTSYGQAFYRQKQRHNGRYTEFMDAFYDVRFTPEGISGWQLAQARYGQVAEDTGVEMTNFSAALRLIPVYEPKPSPKTVAVPLGPRAAQQFSFQLREVLRNKDGETAVIDFAPRPELGQAALTGTLYIDLNTAALRRVESHVPIANLMSLQFGEGTSLDSQTMRMTTDFVPYQDSLSRLQAVRADQRIVLRYQNQTDTTTLSGSLFFYRYTPKQAGKGYKATGINYNDLRQARKQRYDPTFWRDREVLRASPAEERVIRDLEQQQAFGTF